MLEFSEDGQDIDGVETASQNLDKSLKNIVNKFLEPLYERLNEIACKQKELVGRLRKFSGILKDSPELIELHQISSIITIYRHKLSVLLVSMKRITDRCFQMQERINKVRKQIPSGSGFKETGQFYYRCCYQGGIRVRVSPSIQATLSGVIIPYGEVFEANERVFLNGDSIVYVHMLGGGWLFECTKDLQCLERCTEKDKPRDAETRLDNPNPDTQEVVEDINTTITTTTTTNTTVTTVSVIADGRDDSIRVHSEQVSDPIPDTYIATYTDIHTDIDIDIDGLNIDKQPLISQTTISSMIDMGSQAPTEDVIAACNPSILPLPLPLLPLDDDISLALAVTEGCESAKFESSFTEEGEVADSLQDPVSAPLSPNPVTPDDMDDLYLLL
eukprot:gene3552-7067_t